MASTSDLLKLRLAARTLIEWKIPTTTRVYKNVLADILECHPYATTLGLKPSSELFKIDHSRRLLWFLSETLLSKQTHQDGRSAEEVLFMFDKLSTSCLNTLMEYGAGESADLPAWTQGPPKASVLEITLQCLNSNEGSVAYSAHKALASMLSSDESLRERVLRDFLATPKYSEGVAELGVHSKTKVLNVLVLFLQLVGGLALIFEGLQLSTNWPLASLKLSYIIWATILLVPLGAPRYRRFTYSLIRSSVLIGHRELFANIFDRLRNIPAFFALPFEDLCSGCPGYLSSLVVSDQDLARLALGSTTKANKDVILSVLELLPNAQVDLIIRENLFRWLCGVSLVREPKGRLVVSLVEIY